ncbi:MAG TPA: hypothetical protein PK113_03180 [Bacillota bacterium]|nr:hypothetical protein [Bacillota bacterium]
MLNFLVGVMLYSFWISLILNFIVLFGLRLIYVIKEGKQTQDALMILFLPFSFGYLKDVKAKSFFHTIYQIILIFVFLTIAIGGVMIFYTHFA